MRHLVPLVLLAAGTLIACDGVQADRNWEDQSLTDSGTVCVEGDADANATITVWADTCLSSSCSRDAEGSCTASLDGSTITVTSTFTWQQNVSPRAACTDDCGSIEATCEVGPLPAGTYTLVHGDDSEEITIPAEGDNCSPF